MAMEIIGEAENCDESGKCVEEDERYFFNNKRIFFTRSGLESFKKSFKGPAPQNWKRMIADLMSQAVYVNRSLDFKPPRDRYNFQDWFFVVAKGKEADETVVRLIICRRTNLGKNRNKPKARNDRPGHKAELRRELKKLGII